MEYAEMYNHLRLQQNGFKPTPNYLYIIDIKYVIYWLMIGHVITRVLEKNSNYFSLEVPLPPMNLTTKNHIYINSLA